MHKFDITVVIFFLSIIIILLFLKIKSNMYNNQINEKIKDILGSGSTNNTEKNKNKDNENFTVSAAKDNKIDNNNTDIKDSIDDKFKTESDKIPCEDLQGSPSHYKPQAVSSEDYNVIGFNYMNYTDFIHPTKINIRLLSQNTKGLPPDQNKYKNIPTGSNYAFPNSPAIVKPN